MNDSERAKRKLEKFLNTSGSKEKNKNRINFNNINKDNSLNNSSEKKKYKYEYSNLKRDYANINLIKNDDEEKNILLGLIKEGLISLHDLDESKLKNDDKIDINNIKYKEINIEKIIQKLIFLNKSLKKTQNERMKLENEQNLFLNEVNGNKLNNIYRQDNNNKNIYINNNYKNAVNNKLSGKYNYNDILKKYNDDLKYFGELIIYNNNSNEFK